MATLHLIKFLGICLNRKNRSKALFSVPHRVFCQAFHAI